MESNPLNQLQLPVFDLKYLNEQEKTNYQAMDLVTKKRYEEFWYNSQIGFMKQKVIQQTKPPQFDIKYLNPTEKQNYDNMDENTKKQYEAFWSQSQLQYMQQKAIQDFEVKIAELKQKHQEQAQKQPLEQSNPLHVAQQPLKSNSRQNAKIDYSQEENINQEQKSQLKPSNIKKKQISDYPEENLDEALDGKKYLN